MKKMKHLLAYLMILAMVLSCFTGITFTAEASTDKNNPIEIMVGDTKEVVIQNPGEAYWVKFTPEEDGTYVFYSLGEKDSQAYLYDSLDHEEAYIENDDDGLGQGNNFKLTHFMEKDKTYYLKACFWGEEETGNYTLHLENGVPAESIVIDEKTIIGYPNDYYYLNVLWEPMPAIPEAYTWSSDNEEVVTINESGKVELKKVGTATITVKTASGLTDTCSVTVLETEELHVGDTKTVDMKLGNYKRFQFTPEKAGTYALYSEDIQQGELCLYDSARNPLAQNYWEDEIMVIAAELEAGKTYYFECANAMTKPYTVNLTEMKQATEMAFEYSTYTGYVGETKSLYVTFGPGLALHEGWTLTSQNPEIVTIVNQNEIELLKAGTTKITATSDNGLTCTCTVTVKASETLKLDEEKTVSITKDQWAVYFTFTPTESGSYAFYSTDGGDAYGALYDADDMTELARNAGGGVGDNFKIVATLDEGQTYTYIYAINYNESDSVSVKLQKATDITGIQLSNDHIDGYVKSYAYLELDILPANSAESREAVTWTSSNPEIAEITGKDNTWCDLYLKKEGTVTITAEMGNHTDTCTITIGKIPEIKVNDTKPINIQYKHGYGVYEFTPEKDGTYVFSTKSETPVLVEVIVSEDNPIAVDFGTDKNPNVTLELELKAGETYTFASRYIAMNKTGSYTVTLIDKDNPPIVAPDNNTQDTNSVKQEITSPRTGDYAATWLWTVFMLTAVFAGCGTVIYRRKR